jgi:glycogen(starch) synthase
MVARRYGWASIAAQTAAVYRQTVATTPAGRAQPRARLAAGRPAIVVPDGNLLATGPG